MGDDNERGRSMMRFVVPTIAMLSVFWFPWPLTVILLFAASIFVPLSGLVIGVLADVVYGASLVSGMPYGTLVGITAFIVGSLLQRYGKAHFHHL